jgi:hypothetical protein
MARKLSKSSLPRSVDQFPRRRRVHAPPAAAALIHKSL